MRRRRVVILGAAGRDFHNFNLLFRDRPEFEVVAFTATQIPDIEGRTYPTVLAGKLYPDGVPIVAEETLDRLLRSEKIDEAWLSYSDLAHVDVMHLGSRVIAAGAHFVLAGTTRTMLDSIKPVVAITAVRTGVGKSQTTRFVSRLLKAMGKRVVAVRHPMPYGDLARQACQRFATYEDLDRHDCTIEEREEYEPHIDRGTVVFAGVDYERILREAEREADVIVWDGGNNDLPFFAPGLFLVVADPHRPGHEERYYPGETNVRMADVCLINKVDTAALEAVEQVERNLRRLNPRAKILRAGSPVTVAKPEAVRGKRVLVVEDGPTLTHGGMSWGAGLVAARQFGAAEIVEPLPYAVGSIRETYKNYPHLRQVLPAMGYGEKQREELEATINAAPADVVLIGTPIDLSRLLTLNKPAVRVRYELDEAASAELKRLIEEFLTTGGTAR